MGLYTAGLVILILLFSNPNIQGITISKEDYPNPRSEPRRCNRSNPSHICDPDGMLSVIEVDNLDRFSMEMMSSTKCLCSKCDQNTPGVNIGVLIKHNLTNHGNALAATELKTVVELVRERWKLGSCQDDIIIIVITQTKQAEIDMGLPVQEVLTKKLARQIFNDCVGHFENDHYYQGLESMINSYRDALQKNNVSTPKFLPPRTGLIVGLSLGIAMLVFILVAAALFRYRQIRKLKTSQSKRFRKNSKEQTNGIEADDFHYRLCRASGNYATRDVCSSSDEGIDSDEDSGLVHEMSRLHVPTFTDSFRRQLSDVVEENEEEMAAIKFAMVNSPKNSRTHITEL